MMDDFKLLGISPDASPAEVRAAYVACLRRAHPDAASDAPADHELVSDIVRAYRNILEASRRGNGSASLNRDRHAVALCHLRLDGQPHRPPVKWGLRHRAAAMMWIVVLVAGLWAALAARSPHSAASLHPTLETETHTPATSVTPEVDRGVVAGAVLEYRSRSEMPAAGAETYSQRCFDELSGAPTFRLLDYCIAFDTAAASAPADLGEPGRQSPAYFDPELRIPRHRQAIRLLVSDQEAIERHRQEVEAATYSEFLDQVVATGTSRGQKALRQ